MDAINVPDFKRFFNVLICCGYVCEGSVSTVSTVR